MRINEILLESKPAVVRADDPKPRMVKPSRGGESEHPYQGKLVGSKQYGETPVEEAPGDIRRAAGILALAGALWGAGNITSAVNTPLGQALERAAAQGDSEAAKHLKNLDIYVEANAPVLDELADRYLRGLDEDDPCWSGYHMVGMKYKGGKQVPNCVPESAGVPFHKCPQCGGDIFHESEGKKDACYHKVKKRYKVWPSAYASGALVQCRKVGAKNWGNKAR